ncbi:thioredoxin domain-containing protein [Streptomyces oryzae]|uniref:Thioredoxin domain-containing protein n=1 Tax=Streptomyces oryzae TaxID=1434886 RepID=A0ABS3X5F6_9ACTN|nr:thioredoxin domain-containing protein [Streptomyces oryzae]MBO8190609.1 thioredoxin domain-containing protein [Streptomyces oryzae]
MPSNGQSKKQNQNQNQNQSNKSNKSKNQSKNKGIVIGALVAVAALLAGWLSQYAVGGNGADSRDANGNATVEGRSDDTAAGDPALLKLARRSADDPFARGDKDAPVVMIEYADFGCSFCGKFARDTEPKLVEKYVEKGLLRIEWRNYPVFGKGSERAALASYAAGQQGRFWQFYKAVYADKGNEKSSFTTGHLHELAEQAGVKDLDRFDRDRAGKAARKLLDKDRNEAYGLGAAATPAFLVNGQPISGAQPDEVFTDAIERAATAAKKTDKPGRSGDEG